MVSVKTAENSRQYRVSLLGKKLDRETLHPIHLDAALVRLGDKNLEFVFDESDREGLLAVNDKLLELVARELGAEISTQQELVDYLLPALKPKSKPKPKPKAKESVTSSKKSSLVE